MEWEEINERHIKHVKTNLQQQKHIGIHIVLELTNFIKHYVNELSRRLVRYCSVEDATLEGAVCCR